MNKLLAILSLSAAVACLALSGGSTTQQTFPASHLTIYTVDRTHDARFLLFEAASMVACFFFLVRSQREAAAKQSP